MSEMGTVLRKFSPDGKMLWELYGLCFVDLACADPATDGRDVWGIQEHYVMDYTKPAGREAKWIGYSLDRHRYPDDPRGLMFREATGRTRLDLAADCLSERQAVHVRRRHVRQQLHQHLPLRRRNRDSLRPDPAMGQRSLQHRPQMAAEQAAGNFDLARRKRRRRLPGGRVRAEHRPRATRSVLGG